MYVAVGNSPTKLDNCCDLFTLQSVLVEFQTAIRRDILNSTLNFSYRVKEHSSDNGTWKKWRKEWAELRDHRIAVFSILCFFKKYENIQQITDKTLQFQILASY